MGKFPTAVEDELCVAAAAAGNGERFGGDVAGRTINRRAKWRRWIDEDIVHRLRAKPDGPVGVGVPASAACVAEMNFRGEADDVLEAIVVGDIENHLAGIVEAAL